MVSGAFTVDGEDSSWSTDGVLTRGFKGLLLQGTVFILKLYMVEAPANAPD